MQLVTLPPGCDSACVGAARFTFDDFGGLNTDALRTGALPWKIVAASLALDRSRHGQPLALTTVYAALGEFGFVTPTSIANWPAGPPPELGRPSGIITGAARRGFPVSLELEIANLGCASCHGGVLYDADGNATRDVWLGLPNTSLDVEAFSQDVYRALIQETADTARLMATVRLLFPSISAREQRSLSKQILPRLIRALAELRASIDAPAPFPNGGPGLTNGPGALKRRFDLLPADALRTEAGFVSVPELGDVSLRTSLLADGGMTPLRHGDVPAAVSFFTVPSLGNSPSRAERIIPRMREAFVFLRTYRSPKFPGTIDSALARQGRVAYDSWCASCHGQYDGPLDNLRLTFYPNRLVPRDSIGSDATRLAVLDAPIREAMMASAYNRHVRIEATGGYVAPRLNGLWATAPYLHNASVPTLWHLMHPAERPARFEVGGHRLDYELVGIAGACDSTGTWRYTAGYRPWSRPALHDTSRPGLGNQGHEREFADLTEDTRRALIEFLKLL